MIGLLSDSDGDLSAFGAGYELLRSHGARRFIFAGGRYADLDDWIEREKAKSRGPDPYTDIDFLADISNFLEARAQVDRPPAFGEDGSEQLRDDLDRLRGRFTRVPDRASLQYRDESVPRKAVDMLGDHLCCVVHDKNDLTREDLLNASVFIHGREAEPKVVQIGPRYFLTPGRLSGSALRACALIQVVERSVSFTAFDLDGKVLVDPQPLALDRRTKLSVK